MRCMAEFMNNLLGHEILSDHLFGPLQSLDQPKITTLELDRNQGGQVKLNVGNIMSCHE